MYSYQVPDGFDRRVEQYLVAIAPNTKVLTDLRRCHYDFEDLGNAYYAGIRPSLGFKCYGRNPAWPISVHRSLT